MDTIILEKHELVDSWPGTKNAYKCVVLNPDNTKATVNIPKAKCELLMYLSALKSKLSEAELTKLKKMIDEFGDERYYDAIMQEAMDDAGADI